MSLNLTSSAVIFKLTLKIKQPIFTFFFKNTFLILLWASSSYLKVLQSSKIFHKCATSIVSCFQIKFSCFQNGTQVGPFEVKYQENCQQPILSWNYCCLFFQSTSLWINITNKKTYKYFFTWTNKQLLIKLLIFVFIFPKTNFC